MFHCILHYAKSDRKLAQELKKQLQSLMLVHLNGHYPARVQLLPDVVPDCVKAKALREILRNEMTATFIILRTTAYANDSSAQETGFRITTVGMEEPTFRVIQLFFEQEEPTTSDYVDVNITYQENSSEFLEKMVNILKGTSFEEGLNHDEIRRKCEEGRSKIHRRLSLQDHSAAKRGFQRRNTTPPSHRANENKYKSEALASASSTRDNTQSSFESRLTPPIDRGTQRRKRKSNDRIHDISSGSLTTDSQPTSSSGHQGDVSNSSGGFSVQDGKSDQGPRVERKQPTARSSPATGNASSTALGQLTISSIPLSVQNIDENVHLADVSAEEAASVGTGSDFIPIERENESGNTTSSDLSRREKSPIVQFNDLLDGNSSNSTSGGIPKWSTENPKRQINHFQSGPTSRTKSNIPAGNRGDSSISYSSSSTQELIASSNKRATEANTSRKANTEGGSHQSSFGREHRHEPTGKSTASTDSESCTSIFDMDNDHFQDRPVDRRRQVAVVTPVPNEDPKDLSLSGSHQTFRKTYTDQRSDASQDGNSRHTEDHSEDVTHEDSMMTEQLPISGSGSLPSSTENDPGSYLPTDARLRYVCIFWPTEKNKLETEALSVIATRTIPSI